MSDFEIRSKSQLRFLLNQLVRGGHIASKEIDSIVNKFDLPDKIGARKGEVNRRLGGRRIDFRRSKPLKGKAR